MEQGELSSLTQEAQKLTIKTEPESEANSPQNDLLKKAEETTEQDESMETNDTGQSVEHNELVPKIEPCEPVKTEPHLSVLEQVVYT